MNFRIADTFRSSLSKLVLSEQKLTKTTVYDLQVDPSQPGLRFHRLDKCKDPNFWSVSVNLDIRIIVHKTASDFLICYVGHHANAYNWGERRRLDKHPKTGAFQLVEVRERVQEIPVFRTVEVVEQPQSVPSPALDGVSREDLLQYGVPEDWIEDVLQADQDQILDIAERLPQEAAEAVLDLATGTTPQVPQVVAEEDGFNHPDAQRRFRLFTDEEELALALDYPWEQWTIFLHPSQKRLVDQAYSGPARVTGSAGTGKTVVALHRAVQIAKGSSDASVLLTTFSPALADLLQIKLNRLAGASSDVAKRIVVQALPDVIAELYQSRFGAFDLADDDFVRTCIKEAIAKLSSDLAPEFVWSEWRLVLDAWQVPEFEDYQKVPRIGRKTRLGVKQRERVWQVCSVVRDRLDKLGKITWATAFGLVTEALESEEGSPYQSVVVDEAQDLGVAELRFLAQVGQGRPDSLFFAGDSGQRIFQQPFSWKALGVDIRGRSNRLRVNYRTSHQIRQAADILLPGEVSDVDGNVEERTGTVSVFNGPAPFMAIYKDPDAEIEGVASHLLAFLNEGMVADELAVFVRSEAQLPRARATFKQAGLEWTELERTSLPPPGRIALSTMHLAKGLEFRAVVVMACDYDVVPLAERIEAAADEYELEETFNTERHLLYVAATRARERLVMTGVSPGSEFLVDMEEGF